MGCFQAETANETRARQPRRRFGATLGIAITVWMLAAGFGLAEITRYSNQPGEAPVPPGVWPKDAGLRREAARPTLLIVVHPRCPCSRASLAELAVLLARADGRVGAKVLFVEPPGTPRARSDGDLWRIAGDIPGVARIHDRGGAIAARFRLATSGHTVLYDAAGALRFSGGITAARGHEGDNAGRAAIIALIDGGTSDDARTSVFGCPLFDRAWRAQLAGTLALRSRTRARHREHGSQSERDGARGRA